MKTKYLFFLLLLGLPGNETFAQDSPQNKTYDFPRRNSVYIQNMVIFPSLYYDRVIPVNDHFGVIPKLGVISGLGYGSSMIFESSFFVGGNKHYGEFGVGIWLSEYSSVPIILNYRYIGNKGLLIKCGYRFADVYMNFLIVGIGYSF